MMNWKKILKRVVAGGIAASFICGLSGCTVYTKDDLAEHTKKRLKEEYGEEFEIKTVLSKYDTVAYPVNNPQLLFEASYVMSNGNSYNHYLQEIVGQQFKELIEEKLVDFKYKYYIDINVGWSEEVSENENVDTDITIEEFDKLTESTPYNKLEINIYMSSKALNYSDEELYKLIESIASIHSCYIDIYFITDDYFNKLAENFSKRSRLSSGLYSEMSDKFTYICLLTLENGELREDLTKFTELMKEVRENELYR